MVQKSNGGSTAAGEDRVRRRADARRLEILRAAARTFRRSGFAGAGMREIAREADLSPGNLYHYFEGKHELLYFCQDRALDVMLDAVDRARRDDGAFGDRVRGVLEAHVRCVLDDLEAAAAHLEFTGLPEEQHAALVKKRDRYERGLRRLVQSGIRDGEFEARDAAVVTRAMLGAANWTTRWFRPGGGQSAGTVAAETARYLVAGLLRPRESDAPRDRNDDGRER